jgi:hypothetical protein
MVDTVTNFIGSLILCAVILFVLFGVVGIIWITARCK